MSISPNDARFDKILKTLESSQYINEELTKVEKLGISINDEYLGKLIENANELTLNLNTKTFREEEYRDLLANCPELEPIVSIPVKLSSYIYDDSKFSYAIELLELSQQYYKKYGHQVSILEDVYKQTEKLRECLIANLCIKLTHLKDSTQNEAFTIVNYLSRCGNLSFEELKLKYLQARDNWFTNACKEQSSTFDNVVSIYSKGLPMIFNEYKNIFSSDTRQVADESLFKITLIESSKENGAMIHSWLLLKISTFIASLEVYLDTVHQNSVQTPSMIKETMEKCVELTNVLSSIGFDFSSQLRPLFYKALVEELKSSIEKATSRFETAFASAVSRSVESLLLPIDDDILKVSSADEPHQQLPKSIDHYPIFKIYCLHLIDSLRWLQSANNILTPINLCLITYELLNGSLTRVMQALSTMLNLDNNSNHPILTKIAITFVADILPFMVNHCGQIFPEKIILNALGLTKLQFKTLYIAEPERLKNFRLDLKQIADPLKGTMPSLLETIEY